MENESWSIPPFAVLRDFITLFPAAFYYKMIKALIMTIMYANISKSSVFLNICPDIYQSLTITDMWITSS